MGIGGPGCLFQLCLGSVRVSESQVLGNGPVEKVGVLGDHGDSFAQFVERYVRKIPSAQLDGTLLGVEEPQNQPHYG